MKKKPDKFIDQLTILQNLYHGNHMHTLVDDDYSHILHREYTRVILSLEVLIFNNSEVYLIATFQFTFPKLNPCQHL